MSENRFNINNLNQKQPIQRRQGSSSGIVRTRSRNAWDRNRFYTTTTRNNNNNNNNSCNDPECTPESSQYYHNNDDDASSYYSIDDASSGINYEESDYEESEIDNSKLGLYAKNNKKNSKRSLLLIKILCWFIKCSNMKLKFVLFCIVGISIYNTTTSTLFVTKYTTKDVQKKHQFSTNNNKFSNNNVNNKKSKSSSLLHGIERDDDDSRLLKRQDDKKKSSMSSMHNMNGGGGDEEEDNNNDDGFMASNNNNNNNRRIQNMHDNNNKFSSAFHDNGSSSSSSSSTIRRYQSGGNNGIHSFPQNDRSSSLSSSSSLLKHHNDRNVHVTMKTLDGRIGSVDGAQYYDYNTDNNNNNNNNFDSSRIRSSSIGQQQQGQQQYSRYGENNNNNNNNNNSIGRGRIDNSRLNNEYKTLDDEVGGQQEHLQQEHYQRRIDNNNNNNFHFDNNNKIIHPDKDDGSKTAYLVGAGGRKSDDINDNLQQQQPSFSTTNDSSSSSSHKSQKKLEDSKTTTTTTTTTINNDDSLQCNAIISSNNNDEDTTNSSGGGGGVIISTKVINDMIYWNTNNKEQDYNHMSSIAESSSSSSTNNSSKNKKKKNKKKRSKTKYLSFEDPPNQSWNDKRMMFETLVIMSYAMDRTLVLPPKTSSSFFVDGAVSMLEDYDEEESDAGGSISYKDIYDINSIVQKYKGSISVISMEEFLTKEGLNGKLRSNENGMSRRVVAPPNGRVNWDSAENSNELWSYIRLVSQLIPNTWNPEECLLSFSSSKTISILQQRIKERNLRRKKKINLVDNNSLRGNNNIVGDDDDDDTIKLDGEKKRTKKGNEEESQQQKDEENEEEDVDDEELDHPLIQLLNYIMDGIHDPRPKPKPQDFQGNPTNVIAPTIERLREALGERTKLCLYDDEGGYGKEDEFKEYSTSSSGKGLVHEKLVHVPLVSTIDRTVIDISANNELYQDEQDHVVQTMSTSQVSSHFYSFIFFEDYHDDLWSKRFVRDEMKYTNSIICSAARIIDSLNKQILSTTYDSFHIVPPLSKQQQELQQEGRQQFNNREQNFIDVNMILLESKDKIKPGMSVYIATEGIVLGGEDEEEGEIQDIYDSDDRRKYFKPLEKIYDVHYLHDYVSLISDDIPPIYYGLIEQLICAKSNIFMGIYGSTYTNYVNRLRGYYSTKNKLDGYEDGILDSYYYSPSHAKKEMRIYHSVRRPTYSREWPVSWRDIDKDFKVTTTRNI